MTTTFLPHVFRSTCAARASLALLATSLLSALSGIAFAQTGTGTAPGGAPAYPYNSSGCDYGLYWYGKSSAKGGASKKAYADGRSMTGFYDPNKPTIIYVHGWQEGSVAGGKISGTTNSQGREELFFNEGQLNVAHYWIEQGWNVGQYHWTQLADDEGYMVKPYNSQAKIWTATYGLKNNDGSVKQAINMRCRTTDNQYNANYQPTQSVHELFYNDYKAAMSQYSYNGAETIRIIGHSLGHQVATGMLFRLHNDATVAANRKPMRLILADPYWGPTGPGGGHHYDYLAPDANIGARITRYAKDLSQNKGVVVEWFKSSRLNDLGGDNNMALVEWVSRTEWDPTFITDWNPAAGLSRKHGAAPRLYFWSKQFAAAKDCATNSGNNACADTGKGAASGATSVTRSRAIMQAKSTWFQQIGSNSATPNDNGFKVTQVLSFAKRLGDPFEQIKDQADSLRLGNDPMRFAEDAYIQRVQAGHEAPVAWGQVAPSRDWTAPSTPEDVAIQAQDGARVMLAWSESSDNVGVSGYAIYANGQLIGSTDKTFITLWRADLPLMGPLKMTVRAFDATGNLSTEARAIDVSRHRFVALPQVQAQLE